MASSGVAHHLHLVAPVNAAIQLAGGHVVQAVDGVNGIPGETQGVVQIVVENGNLGDRVGILGGRLLEGSARQPELAPMLQTKFFLAIGLLDDVEATRGRVLAQGSEVPRVQDVIRCEPIQIVGRLCAVRIRERVDDHVDVVQLFTLLGVGEQEFGVPLLGQIPIEMAVREGGDQGKPVTQSAPDSEVAQSFRALAGKVAQRVSILNAE